MSDGPLVLILPPQTEYLGTARSFAAAVARHYAVVGETVEDLKIAISEACVEALDAGAPIRVRAEEADRVVAFSVEAAGDGRRSGDAEPDGRPARIDLIRSLFPDADLSAERGRTVIRFSLATA